MKKSILTSSEIKAIKALALDKIITGIIKKDCSEYLNGVNSLYENDIITLTETGELITEWNKLK